ncbi:regulatory Fis family protein [Aquabacterium commune]|uniref:Regulatory Fis family protein n=2 Tax=Aquabacterium commune TaxID=70586 RepID=A0A4R6RN80_9BURK|nr:regulatory Fis family protein [Aquabacterium commune]
MKPMTPATDRPTFRGPAAQALQDSIQAAAATDHHVLLLGDAGTGKRHLARHLHACSRRGPFLAVDCSAHDAVSLGIGLHGHEAGAVRGGFAATPGWFEAALDGTVFLDEVHALSLDVQQDLLSVMRSGQVRRVGGRHATPVNVRLVCATSQDLAQAVAEGRFLADLLRLVSTVTLAMPALRDRPDDILPLARSLLQDQSRHLKQAVPGFSACAEQALLRHTWPGHLRELEAVLHRALLRAPAGVIRAEDLMLPVGDDGASAAHTGAATPASPDEALLADLDALLGRMGERFEGRLFEVVERSLFSHAHRRCGQHQIQAARLLGVSRNVLRGRLIALGEIDARK